MGGERYFEDERPPVYAAGLRSEEGSSDRGDASLWSGTHSARTRQGGRMSKMSVYDYMPLPEQAGSMSYGNINARAEIAASIAARLRHFAQELQDGKHIVYGVEVKGVMEEDEIVKTILTITFTELSEAAG